MVVNMHAAKSGLSRLVKRVEKGERITIARAGRPVAQLVPAQKQTRFRLPLSDPLHNLDSFAVSGPGGKLTNEDIDRTLYGSA
jgi:prevent-host-death family protein